METESLLRKKLRVDPAASAKLLAEMQRQLTELDERLKRIENYLKPGSHPGVPYFGQEG